MANRSAFGRFLRGAALGVTLGYTAARGYEMWRDQTEPVPARPRDAKRYGDARRLLTVVDLARTAAAMGMWAFVLGDGAERAFAPLPRPLRLPLAAGAMTLLDALREWPVDYVEGYLTERIYGNSERTGSAWAGERIKGTAIGLGVTFVLTALIDAIVHRAPRRWPWLAIAGTPPLLVFANVVAPTFIMPLFNKYLPLEGPLEQKIRTLASRYGVGHAMILRFDMSRQTKKANAFVTGVFGTERIAIADTLLDEFAEDETLFVVAHELGHYVRRDPWYAVALGTALTAASLLTATTIVRRTTGRAEGIGAMVRLAFYMVLAQFVAMPFANGFSRAIERRADRFAIAATDDPQSGVRAFRRLRDQNLAEDEGPRWSELLFSSHPSLKSRIAALEAIAPR
jgi:Zn-dependent protease with chaperone function